MFKSRTPRAASPARSVASSTSSRSSFADSLKKFKDKFAHPGPVPKPKSKHSHDHGHDHSHDHGHRSHHGHRNSRSRSRHRHKSLRSPALSSWPAPPASVQAVLALPEPPKPTPTVVPAPVATPVVFKTQVPTPAPTSLAAPAPVPTPAPVPEPSLISDSYLATAGQRSNVSRSVEPKTRLLVCDIDNTLIAPADENDPSSTVQARPYLKTFIKWVMHPDTPYDLAIWTLSGRAYGIAHLRSLGLGKFLFNTTDLLNPEWKRGLVGFWGYEDSGKSPYELSRGLGPEYKDLSLMWDFVNAHKEVGSPDSSAHNTLIVDDQVQNGAAQPHSLIQAPLYVQTSPDDDFLLRLIAVLSDLSVQTNFAATVDDIKRFAFNNDPQKDYAARAIKMCEKLDIRVSKGHTAADAAQARIVARTLSSPGPVHDAAETPSTTYSSARSMPKPGDEGPLAHGMTEAPTKLYEKEVADPSRIGIVKRPLVIFDLDGTLYTRPPGSFEHDHVGQPAGRPYLRSVLDWLLNHSPYSVAIWTGSIKAEAAKCLYELDLGIVGPLLVGPNKDQAELLHPNLVAFWAREEFHLTPTEFKTRVSVVKDLDWIWEYLKNNNIGDWTPYNSILVDDTPAKARAQPDNLIAAPTFDYPMEPSRESVRAMLDTFLLKLVGMLTELSTETNFANYISKNGWFDGADGRDHEFERWGEKELKKAGILIEAEARYPIENGHLLNDATKRLTIKDTPAVFTPRHPTDGYLTAVSPSTEASSFDMLSGTPSPPLPASTSHLDLPSDDGSDSDTPRFVREMEAEAELRKKHRIRKGTQAERLKNAVDDWEVINNNGDPRTLSVRG